MKKKLIVLSGPTAVGKSALSVALAKKIGGEIISADSMQVYRGLDIGSAKISPEEMQGVPHYLIDVLEPEESFDVASFQAMAKEAMEKIWSAGHIPILTGGTGFYIQSVVYDIGFTSHESDPDFRRHLEEIAGVNALSIHRTEETRSVLENGTAPGGLILHKMLEEADPESAAQIHPNNIKRMIRALEYCHLTGQKISCHNAQEHARQSPYNFVYFVLNDERSEIYERIDQRVDRMMHQGLRAEVEQLRDRGISQELCSMQGLGYKEMFRCLEGKLPEEEAVRLIKRNTRHFAKRQITWFKREREVTWINRQEFGRDDERILLEMLRILKEKQIID